MPNIFSNKKYFLWILATHINFGKLSDVKTQTNDFKTFFHIIIIIIISTYLSPNETSFQIYLDSLGSCSATLRTLFFITSITFVSTNV